MQNNPIHPGEIRLFSILIINPTVGKLYRLAKNPTKYGFSNICPPSDIRQQFSKIYSNCNYLITVFKLKHESIKYFN